MTAPFDTSARASNSGSVSSLTTAAMTIAATADRYALVDIGYFSNSQSVSSVTVGGVSGTKLGATVIRSTEDRFRFETWRVLNPGSGSQTAGCVFGGAVSAPSLACSVYNGVNQSTPTRTEADAEGTASPSSAAGTSVSGDQVHGYVFAFADAVATGQTVNGADLDNYGGSSFSAGQARTTAAGASTAITHTLTSSTYWIARTVALIDAAAGGSSQRNLMLLGVG